MSLILALEPDHRQASILRKVVTSDLQAELTIVDSRDAAMAALSARVPDVILLTALLSPRDEEDLIAHLRTLDGVEHVQTHTLPMLATAAVEEPASGGLFGRLRRRKVPEAVSGCDVLLEITQHGSTRSLNAGAAAAIVMYHWALQHA